MELISVIVPIYKVEAYLRKCIDSIISQSYKNLEIILVDDGSPDGCPAICDEYAARDQRIKVIHQPNGGAGKARNTALKVASGELIAFVDSDDILHPQMYEKLYSVMSDETDVAECDFESFSEDFDFPIINNAEAENVDAIKALKLHIEGIRFTQLIWNKLYRRHTLNGVFFPEGNKIDDEFFTYKAIGNSRRLCHISEKLYAYRQQEGSVMHNLSPKHRFQGITAKLERYDYLKSKYPELLPLAVCDLYFTCLYQAQIILRSENKDTDTYKKIIDAIKKNSISFSDMRAVGFKQRIWLIASTLCFGLTCRLRNLLKIGI